LKIQIAIIWTVTYCSDSTYGGSRFLQKGD